MLTAGHRIGDIRGYTLQQLSGFVELAGRYKRLQIKDAMIAVRVGFGAEQKDWKQIMKDLESHG